MADRCRVRRWYSDDPAAGGPLARLVEPVRDLHCNDNWLDRAAFDRKRDGAAGHGRHGCYWCT